MPLKVVILRHVGTEDQAIEQILPKEYNNEQEAYDMCIAIEESRGFDYCRLAAEQIEIEKINEMIKIEIETLAATLEQGGFAFWTEGQCSAHEYIHGTICEAGAGKYTHEAAIRAINAITQEMELD